MKRQLKRFKFFLKDSNKKPAFKILKDITSLWYLKKEFPLHYFGRFLYRKDAPEAKNFMTQSQYNKLVNYLVKVNNENSEDSKLLDNKLSFFKHCKNHGFTTPEIVSYSTNNTYYFQDKKLDVKTLNEFQEFFINLLKEYKSLCLKPIDSKAGIGVLIITKNDIENNADYIWKTIKNKNYIHQEVIEQHPDINKIYSKSINSLRIETFLDSNNTNHILGTLMRFGSNGSQVDNISQGGFFVPVNSINGTLFKYGRTNLIHEGKLLAKHPDTNFAFENFNIPFFTESIKLVKTATLKTPGYLYAWDIAITPNGPIIIEGNNYPSLTTGELSYGGYKNKEAFKEIFKNANIKY